MAKALGRPKLPDDERRDFLLRIRVSKHELWVIEDAAGIVECPTSTWARDILLEEAGALFDRDPR